MAEDTHGEHTRYQSPGLIPHFTAAETYPLNLEYALIT